MTFFLTAIKLYYILDPNLTPLPEPTDTDTEKEKDARLKHAEDTLLCRVHLLNALSDRLYNFLQGNGFSYRDMECIGLQV